MNYFKPIQLTQLTINSQLFPSEYIIHSQAGVGIYDGKNKDQRFQDGILYLTSHRLIYLDRFNSNQSSCFLDISLIRQTEYWIGFLTSSPKITLLLGHPPHPTYHSTLDQDFILNHPATSHWACHVCGFSNPPDLKCGLCGIPKDLSHTNTISKSHSNSNIPNLSSKKLESHEDNLSSALGSTSLSDLNINLNGSASLQTPSLKRSPSLINDSAKIIKEISCPSCTFLNHPSMSRCEICNSILGTLQVDNPTSNQISTDPDLVSTDNEFELKHSHATTPAPPASFPSGCYIRLSFRKGGDKSFYLNLKKTLQNKTWKIGEIQNQTNNNHNSGLSLNDSKFSQFDQLDGESVQNLNKPIGIDGILKTMDSQHQTHQAELTESLADLHALMAKAKEMVQMAQTINSRITNLETNKINDNQKITLNEENEKTKNVTLIKSSLYKLGLTTPAVTQDMMDSDDDFFKELAKELAGLLNRKVNHQNQLENSSSTQSESSTGIWTLDEIWCIWNRARGISLVSPNEMISACQYLHLFTHPQIYLKQFHSGVKVLHNSSFCLDQFELRLIKRLKNDNQNSNNLNKLTNLEIAKSEKINIFLTNELLNNLELNNNKTCSIVRDFNPINGITFWYSNLISDFVWVDPNF